MRNLIILYDIENSELKKVYMKTEESTGNYNSYFGNYYFKDSSFSCPNIFLIT